MKYDISTTVSFTLEEEITLPAITICANIMELGNWEDQRLRSKCDLLFGQEVCLSITSPEQFTSLVIKIGQEGRREAANKLFEASSISEILNMTLQITKLIAAHTRHVMVNNEKKDLFLHLNETFEIFASFIGIVTCFTLSWRKPFSVVSTQKLNRNPASIGVFANLFWSEMASNISFFTLTYTGNDIQPRIGHVDFVFLPVTGLSSSSYNLFMSKLLGPPFATECLDYKKEYGFDNRAHCYESCYANAGIKAFNRKPLGLRMDASDGSMKSMNRQFAEKHHDELETQSKECDNKCSRQDCLQATYSTQLRSSDKGSMMDITGHIAFLPNSPVVLTECMQKVTFAEFATDVSSTFGFWLGLSVLTAMTWVQKIVSGMFCRNENKQKTRTRMMTDAQRKDAIDLYKRHIRIHGHLHSP